MNASYNSRKSSLNDIGVKTTLTYQQFVRACTGYVKMVEEEDFLCSPCGDFPSYVVCDGKTDGPTKPKVEHLHELDRTDHDETCLRQGSFFEDCVFLSESCERKMVCNLLTNTISIEEFVESETILSSNGNLVVQLVVRIALFWPEEIPKPYKRLIGNICKISGVAGLLQVLSSEPLE